MRTGRRHRPASDSRWSRWHRTSGASAAARCCTTPTMPSSASRLRMLRNSLSARAPFSSPCMARKTRMRSTVPATPSGASSLSKATMFAASIPVHSAAVAGKVSGQPLVRPSCARVRKTALVAVAIHRVIGALRGDPRCQHAGVPAAAGAIFHHRHIRLHLEEGQRFGRIAKLVARRIVGAHVHRQHFLQRRARHDRRPWRAWRRRKLQRRKGGQGARIILPD